MDKEYVKSFSSRSAYNYYLSSIEAKTEQQKLLERQLLSCYSKTSSLNICDLCCGGGSVSFHLAELFVKWNFELLDLSETAKDIVSNLPRPLHFTQGSAYHTPYQTGFFDIVICWNTLLHLESPALMFQEASRILKPSGILIVSTLANLYHDTDIIAKVIDYADQSHIDQFGYPREYIRNTYSIRSIQTFMGNEFVLNKAERFDIQKPLHPQPIGIGTYTVPIADSQFLQVSGGYLMNWAYLEFLKQS